MEVWFLLALGASISIAITHVFDKILTNYVNAQLLPAIKKAINGTILLLVSVFFFSFNIPLSAHFWIFIAILVSLDIFSTLSYFAGIEKGEVSKLICYNDSLLVVLTFLFGVLFLSESVTFFNGVGVFLIALGSYTVLSDGKIVVPDRTQALELITISAFLWAIFNLTVKVAVGSFPPYLLAMLIYFVGDPFLWGYNIKENREEIRNIKETFNLKLVLVLIVACIGSSLTSLMTYFALKIGNASLVLPVVYSSPLFTVILSGRILKEKRIGLRILGASLVVLGIFGVYFF